VSPTAPVTVQTNVDPPPARPAPAAAEPTGKLAGILVAHNRVRAQVGVAPLRWSDAIARFAQRRADQLARRDCALQHDTRNTYGENLFWTSGSTDAAHVVATWGAERQHYDRATNKCAATCGHYTQVVWAGSTQLGCGAASCGNAEIWVCNYDPPGNVIGRKPF
jgi:uncharacterized protein YkwD